MRVCKCSLQANEPFQLGDRLMTCLSCLQLIIVGGNGKFKEYVQAGDKNENISTSQLERPFSRSGRFGLGSSQ